MVPILSNRVEAEIVTEETVFFFWTYVALFYLRFKNNTVIDHSFVLDCEILG